tara:strand:- start:604 stop:1341 length:738 start_codon:yes stop_codon:yes gene_type:complete
MNNILVLIIKELLNIKKNILQYIFILFLFPSLLFMFLAIPLSKVFIDLKPIYSVWVCSGVLFVSVLFNIYVFNLGWFKKMYDNDFMKSLPITTSEYLLSQISFSIIIGFFQYTISVLILNSLSIGFMNFIQFIKCFFILFPSMVIISNISLISNYFIKNKFSFNIFNSFVFLFLSFSIGSLVPLDLYPKEYINIIGYFPLSATLINIQNIISFDPLYFSMILISFFYLSVFITLSYYIIESKMKR